MRNMINSGVEWLGDIPETWELVQLGSLFSEHKHKNTRMQSNNLLSLSYGSIIRKDINTSEGLLPESFEGYNVIDDGDIVLRLTDLQNDQRSLRVGLSHENGIVTSAYVTLRRRNPTLNSQFFYYLIHSYDVRKGFYGMGAGVRQGLNYAGVKKIMLTLPPVEEQTKIAAFLEDKLSKVDILIANVKTQIEKLKAYKQSVITEVVTKGLDSNISLKDSGVEWIGMIPENWAIVSLGGVTTEIRNGYVGPTRDLFFDDGIRYIQSLHTKDGAIDFDKHPYYVSKEWAEQHPKIHTGDVLIVQTGDIGQVALVDEEFDGCNCHALIIATPNTAIVNPAFLTYYLLSHTGKELMLSFKTGALLPHLNSGKIKSTPVCVPNMETQDAIVATLQRITKSADDLIAIKKKKIEKLEQYKKSLIYEYVTGKKEVS